MYKSATIHQARSHLLLTVAMVTCLVLLINVSFKIIVVKNLTFTVTSLLCPLVAAIFLLSLYSASDEKRWLFFNQSLIALYVFSTGIYLLVNLPAADKLHDQIAYQIIFEDIPKKFFSTTVAFVASFYLPQLYFYFRKKPCKGTVYRLLIVALLGGLSFFTIDFWLLFSGGLSGIIVSIFINSLLITIIGLTLTAFGFIFYVARRDRNALKTNSAPQYPYSYPVYQYLVSFSVVIVLISLACEYRLIAFKNGWILGASTILSPLVLLVSTVLTEIFDYKANVRFIFIVVVAQFAFDLLLMAIVALPSPEMFNLNPYYTFIMPRRIPAATLALLISLGTNAFLLDFLKRTVYLGHPGLRILIANTAANSLLCLVNYSILFVGIFSYEQISHYRLIRGCINFL